jgi:hypothetical protein
MRALNSALFLSLCVACLLFARATNPPPCADSNKLIPFLTKQIKRGAVLVVFQGTAAPQVWVQGVLLAGCKRSQ